MSMSAGGVTPSPALHSRTQMPIRQAPAGDLLRLLRPGPPRTARRGIFR